jgi:hypothetical protein
MKGMETKEVFTLNIGNWAPEVTALTLPLLEAYAKRIGAGFHVIAERKFPDMPITYEKFQLFELTKQIKADWYIFWDADTLIHPNVPDFTPMLTKDTTCAAHASDFSPIRFYADKYFRRDGRYIGKGNWCAIVSDWCTDYWHPLDDMSLEDALKCIEPSTEEQVSGVIEPHHLIDDWLVSRNIARFGLKHVLISQLLQSRGFGLEVAPLYHQYLVPPEKKAIMMKQVLTKWGVAV